MILLRINGRTGDAEPVEAGDAPADRTAGRLGYLPLLEVTIKEPIKAGDSIVILGDALKLD